MKHLGSILWLSALALLCGCGGGGQGGGGTSNPPPPPPNITGNWQFSATSTVPGMPVATIAGSITNRAVQ